MNPPISGEQRYANLTINLQAKEIDVLKNTVVALEMQLESANAKIAELTATPKPEKKADAPA